MGKFNTGTGIKDGKLVDSYVPHPKQVLFHKTFANEVLFGGVCRAGQEQGIEGGGFAVGLHDTGVADIFVSADVSRIGEEPYHSFTDGVSEGFR